MQGPYLVVRPSGAKSRADRYRFSGRTRKYTIAAIAESRSDAPATRPTAIGEGRDPSTEKEARRKSGLYRPQLSTWPSWKNTTKQKSPTPEQVDGAN